MNLTLYAGSGSPFAWRAQLALEHKALPYELRMLSFSAGDTRKPEFMALNPRHKVPVLVDNDFVLYESVAILEYLDETYPDHGQPLYPGSTRERARIRRLILEADTYLERALRGVWQQAFSVRPEERVETEVAKAVEEASNELAHFASTLQGDFLCGVLSAADYVIYPLLAFTRRCEIKLSGFLLSRIAPSNLLAWMQRIEDLPFYDKTYPPHWKQPLRTVG